MTDALTPYLVHFGYSQGAFPMGDEEGNVGWYEPRVRAVFPIDGTHVSRTLARQLRKTSVAWYGENGHATADFQVRFDTAFESVMRSCLRPADNWLTEEIIRVYTQIYHEGWAHCAEVWQGDQLVGGTYGLALGSCFCAESMFHRVTGGSKSALWAILEQCRRLGFTIFDAQVMNPHLASLGAREMAQAKYLRLLKHALEERTPWSPVLL